MRIRPLYTTMGRVFIRYRRYWRHGSVTCQRPSGVADDTLIHLCRSFPLMAAEIQGRHTADSGPQLGLHERR